MEGIFKTSTTIACARFLGVFAPSLYCGITAQRFTASDSLTFVQPIISHAPNEKTMAAQWYRGYQYGPSWVPPMIATGTLSNLYLAYLASNPTQRNLYMAAGLAIFSILPITFFYMEPGINGATKWKVQSLLREEGFHLPDTSIWMPSSRKNGGTAASRRWGEEWSMKELIVFWRKMNNLRWVIGGVAAGLSGWATLALLP